MNVDTTQELRHLSLCTGYGGLDLGLSRALGALRSVAYVEIEAFAVENLVAKIENGHLDAAPIHTNLKTFPFSDFRGSVDIVSGGFPCQPFSAAGQRAGDEDPRHLWPHIVRGIRELGRPPIVFFENVEGIISSKLKSDEWSDPEGTPVLLHVLRELERLGYEATAGVFSAREIGAPHQRKRVFIMGCRSDLSESGRAIVSGMLRDPESGVNLVDTRSNSGRCTRTSLHSERGAVEGRRASVPSERDASDTHAQYASIGTAYPAPRGADQRAWEPPRATVGDARGPFARSSTRGGVQGETQPPMGGDVDGSACGMGYAELCRSVDNRTDELRLLGNGVVPETAARAFSVLWEDIR